MFSISLTISFVVVVVNYFAVMFMYLSLMVIVVNYFIQLIVIHNFILTS